MTKEEYKILIDVLRQSELAESLLAESLDELKKKNKELRELVINVRSINSFA